jgi:hypothetical protein
VEGSDLRPRSFASVAELLIHLIPVLRGEGIRLFGDSGVSVTLEPLTTQATGQVVNPRYRVAR